MRNLHRTALHLDSSLLSLDRPSPSVAGCCRSAFFNVLLLFLFYLVVYYKKYINCDAKQGFRHKKLIFFLQISDSQPKNTNVKKKMSAELVDKIDFFDIEAYFSECSRRDDGMGWKICIVGTSTVGKTFLLLCLLKQSKVKFDYIYVSSNTYKQTVYERLTFPSNCFVYVKSSAKKLQEKSLNELANNDRDAIGNGQTIQNTTLEQQNARHPQRLTSLTSMQETITLEDVLLGDECTYSAAEKNGHDEDEEEGDENDQHAQHVNSNLRTWFNLSIEQQRMQPPPGSDNYGQKPFKTLYILDDVPTCAYHRNNAFQEFVRNARHRNIYVALIIHDIRHLDTGMRSEFDVFNLNESPYFSAIVSMNMSVQAGSVTKKIFQNAKKMHEENEDSSNHVKPADTKCYLLLITKDKTANMYRIKYDPNAKKFMESCNQATFHTKAGYLYHKALKSKRTVAAPPPPNAAPMPHHLPPAPPPVSLLPRPSLANFVIPVTD